MPSRTEWQRRFYESTAWKKKRAFILLRDHWLCQEHLRRGQRVSADMVHHIKPLEHCPELGMVDSNLESLCNTCHEGKHNRKVKNERVPPKGVRILKM